jgi:hypothetical protein
VLARTRIAGAVGALFLVLLLAVMAAPAAAGPTVPITVGTTPGYAIFAEPNTGTIGTNDPAILTHLLNLVNGTPCPSGGTPEIIRVAINSISTGNLPTQIKDKLVEKKNCGVDVRVIVSGTEKSSAAAIALRSGLGTAAFEWCDHEVTTKGGGCVSTHQSGGMHTKMMLFTNTSFANCVVWFGSANLTGQTGAETINNGVTLYNNCTVHNLFRDRVWQPMWDEWEIGGNDFYAPTGRGYLSSSNVTAHASPENGSPPVDIVRERLNGMSSGSGCTVGVSQAMWTARGYPNTTGTDGEAVARRLAALKTGAGGCNIGVIVGNKGDGSANIDSGPKGILTNAGIPIEHGLVHDKYFFMNGGGKSPTVVTGSHNFSLPAWRQNDEVLVELANSQSTYDAYYQHWFTTLTATVP